MQHLFTCIFQNWISKLHVVCLTPFLRLTFKISHRNHNKQIKNAVVTYFWIQYSIFITMINCAFLDIFSWPFRYETTYETNASNHCQPICFNVGFRRGIRWKWPKTNYYKGKYEKSITHICVALSRGSESPVPGNSRDNRGATRGPGSPDYTPHLNTTHPRHEDNMWTVDIVTTD